MFDPALVASLVTEGADTVALLFRLTTGPWADRTGRSWRFTIVGYAGSSELRV